MNINPHEISTMAEAEAFQEQLLRQGQTEINAAPPTAKYPNSSMGTVSRSKIAPKAPYRQPGKSGRRTILRSRGFGHIENVENPISPPPPVEEILTGNSVEPFRPHEFATETSFIRPVGIPLISISLNAYNDMISIGWWAGKNEIGWLGAVEKSGDTYLISDIKLVSQEVSGHETTLTEDGMAELVMEFPDMNDKLHFWGHVHPNNNTNPSPQDEAQMKLFDYNDWFIRGIFGRQGRATFTFFDFNNNLRFDDCPWQIDYPMAAERKAYWHDEVKNKVKPIRYAPTPYHAASRYLAAPASAEPQDDLNDLLMNAPGNLGRIFFDKPPASGWYQPSSRIHEKPLPESNDDDGD